MIFTQNHHDGPYLIEKETPQIQCSQTLKLKRFFERNSSASLKHFVEQSRYAGYANFEQIRTEEGERL